mmetsp:Transcript_14714/g.28293  ORF Transcript_14714/g.28293 Transcript_14714/m.28293 type:complete len:327 (-) Transcript_14714:1124-2104(-)
MKPSHVRLRLIQSSLLRFFSHTSVRGPLTAAAANTRRPLQHTPRRWDCGRGTLPRSSRGGGAISLPRSTTRPCRTPPPPSTPPPSPAPSAPRPIICRARRCLRRGSLSTPSWRSTAPRASAPRCPASASGSRSAPPPSSGALERAGRGMRLRLAPAPPPASRPPTHEGPAVKSRKWHDPAPPALPDRLAHEAAARMGVQPSPTDIAGPVAAAPRTPPACPRTRTSSSSCSATKACGSWWGRAWTERSSSFPPVATTGAISCPAHHPANASQAAESLPSVRPARRCAGPALPAHLPRKVHAARPMAARPSRRRRAPPSPQAALSPRP